MREAAALSLKPLAFPPPPHACTQAGADVTARDVYSFTTLDYIMWQPHAYTLPLLPILVEAGADTKPPEKTPPPLPVEEDHWQRPPPFLVIVRALQQADRDWKQRQVCLKGRAVLMLPASAW